MGSAFETWTAGGTAAAGAMLVFTSVSLSGGSSWLFTATREVLGPLGVESEPVIVGVSAACNF